MKTRIVFLFASLLGLCLFVGSAAQADAPGLTFVVSVNSDGEPADNNSYANDISGNGRYVVFGSFASNLINPSPGYWDLLYVRDNQTGQIDLVSVRDDRSIVQNGAEQPTISGDGRYVAFLSDDPWLMPEANYTRQVYVRDRVAGTNAIASVSNTGEPGDNAATGAEIAANGRYVVFASEATNLAPHDSDYLSDVFVHDLQTGQTARVSEAPDGTPGDGPSGNARISDDGNIIVYTSSATNLVAGDTNGEFDIFIYDRPADRTTRVEIAQHSALGIPGDPAVSGNGRYVAFSTSLGTLTGEEDGARWDVFVYDRQGGAIERVSLDSEDNVPPVGEDSYAPEISYDGRYISFVSTGQLTAEETIPSWPYAYLRDRVAGTTELISVGVNGASSVETYQEDASPLSADGRFVVFRSNWPTVVGEDYGGDGVYVRDRAPETTSFAIAGIVHAPGGGPLAGVTVGDGQGHETTTGANGAFTLTGVASGIYRLSAQKAGYAFEPLVDYVTVPPNPTTSITFQARVAYDISGHVVDPEGYGLYGVVLALSNGDMASTNSDGDYRFEDVAPGDYTLTPAHDIYNFTPAERQFSLSTDLAGQDFTTYVKESSVSGTIVDQDGAPLAGVTVEVSGSDTATTTTDAAGYYAFSGLTMSYGLAVRPTLDNYRFEPEYEPINLPADLTDINFTGISLAVETVYVSTAEGGKIGGLAFGAADILAYDLAGGGWSLYFDGSDVGLTHNVNNFALRADGSILLTLAQAQNVSGVGVASPHDVLLFRPTALGGNTAGTLEMYFDGSDVGLSTAGERIDALTEWQYSLLLSTRGRAMVPSWGETLTARDDDLLIFNGFSLGWDTDGLWQRLGDFQSYPTDMMKENVTGVAYDPLTGIQYLSFATMFNIDGVGGRPGTIIGLRYNAESNGFDAFRLWDARAAGLTVAMDGLEVGR